MQNISEQTAILIALVFLCACFYILFLLLRAFWRAFTVKPKLLQKTLEKPKNTISSEESPADNDMPVIEIKRTIYGSDFINGSLPQKEPFINHQLLILLNNAISNSATIEIKYYGGSRAGKERKIIPLYFIQENLIIAMCLIDKTEKHFYVNRMFVKGINYPKPLYKTENKKISFSIAGIGQKTKRKRKAKIYRAFSKQEAINTALKKDETIAEKIEIIPDDYATTEQIKYLDVLGLAYPPTISKKEATSYLTSHLDFDTMTPPRKSSTSIAIDNQIPFDCYTSDELLSHHIEQILSNQ